MEGVAHFVGQGELAVQGAGVVQQHKGMDLGSGGVSAAPLALVLVNVDPAVFKALFQDFPVVLSQRIQGIIHRLLCLGKGDFGRNVFQKRGIHIVKMQLVHAQQLFAQAHIAVHFVHILVNRLDQIVINGFRNVGAVHGRFPGGSVLPGIGKELLLLVLGIQQAGGRIAHTAQGVIHVFIGALAQHPVAAFFQRHEGALAQGVGLVLGLQGVGELQIRIGQGTVNAVRGVGHFPGGGQQPLLSGRKGMGLSAAQVRQVSAVALQLGASGVEAFQNLLGDVHDLRSRKTEGRTDVGGRADELAAHGLIGGVAGIFIGLAHGVVPQQLQLAVQLLQKGEELKQGLSAFGKGSRKGGDLRQSGQHGGEPGFPSFIGSIQVLQGPLVLLGDLLTGTNGFGIRHRMYLQTIFLYYSTDCTNFQRVSGLFSMLYFYTSYVIVS